MERGGLRRAIAAAVLLTALWIPMSTGQNNCVNPSCTAWSDCVLIGDLNLQGSCFCQNYQAFLTCAANCTIAAGVRDELATLCSVGTTAAAPSSTRSAAAVVISSTRAVASQSLSPSPSPSPSPSRSSAAASPTSTGCLTTACTGFALNCNSALQSNDSTSAITCLCADIDRYSTCVSTCPEVLPSTFKLSDFTTFCRSASLSATLVRTSASSRSTASASTSVAGATSAPSTASTSPTTTIVTAGSVGQTRSDSSLTTGAIVGIAVGSVAALAAITGLILFARRRRVRTSSNDDHTFAALSTSGVPYKPQGAAPYELAAPGMAYHPQYAVPPQAMYYQQQQAGYDMANVAAAPQGGYYEQPGGYYVEAQQQQQPYPSITSGGLPPPPPPTTGSMAYSQQYYGNPQSILPPQSLSQSQMFVPGQVVSLPRTSSKRVNPTGGQGSGGDADADVVAGVVESLTTTEEGNTPASLGLVAPPPSAATVAVAPGTGVVGSVVGIGEVVAVQRAFAARSDDELTVQVGDQVEVQQAFDDGWVQARIVATGLVGVFPRDCLTVG